MGKIRREDIKELYSIRVIDGTLILEKCNIDSYIESKGNWDYKPDVLINPDIEISNGLLRFSGVRLTREIRGKRISYQYVPIKTSELEDSWEDNIFYSDDDILEKNVVEWVGTWPFKKRVVHKNVKHLKAYYYLKTDGKFETQTTSNFRLVDGLTQKTQTGVITG